MDTRTDSGQFYPGGKVLPRQPGGGGGTVVLDDTVTEASQNGVKSSGIWTWVKSLLPSWLTPSREEPPTQESIVGKRPVKPLPKYLHYLSFDDPYKADAEAWYESLSPDAMGGACSAVRRGGRLFRNYDWTFDSAAEFVVRMSAAEGRHASVGVASLGAALTEDEAASGVYTAKYRALPGMTLDGINDAGVVCEINVDGGPKTGWHGDAEDEGIHILAAVRWVLDHGKTAEQAAEWLADHIIQPAGDMNFHFMVADATSTYIVENGEAHDVTNGTKVLTNYGVFDAAQAGGGKERYDLLEQGADISSVHWTNAYQPGNTWHSDFESEAQHAAAIEQWAAQGTNKEAHRGKTTTSSKPWWQTVHTSEYDFAARTLLVAVQESGEYFTFAAGAKFEVAWGDVKDKPETFPPSSHTHPQSQVTGLEGSLAAKRDLTDRQWGERTFSEWTLTAAQEAADCIGVPPPVVTWNDPAEMWMVEGLADGWHMDGPTEEPQDALSVSFFIGKDGIDSGYYLTATRTETTDHLALDSETDAKLAGKVDAVAGKGLSTNDYTDEEKAEVAKVEDKRDKTNDDVYETAQRWVFSDGVEHTLELVEYWAWIYLLDGQSSTYSQDFSSREDALAATALAFNSGLTAEKENYDKPTGQKLLKSGLDDDGVPLDPNVAELFSESDTSTEANPDLNNKVLQASVNALIDAKVGDVNVVLAAALGGSEVE